MNRVGTSGDYAPFSKDGAGFDVDVARLFAAEQARARARAVQVAQLAQSLERGDFEVAMSGVTWRPDRDVHGWLTLAIGRAARAGSAQRSPAWWA